MKFLNKAILLMYIITTNAVVLSYELFFSNATNKHLVIMSKKRAGIKEKYYQIVPPGDSVIQIWDDANCPESLQWAELNPKLPLHGGLDLVDKSHGYQIPNNKQETFRRTFTNIGDKGKGLYLWNDLKIIVVPSEIYKETREAATKLFKGFDKMVCQTIDLLTASVKDKTVAPLKKIFDDAKAKLNTVLQEKIDAEKNKLSAEKQTQLDTLITKLQEAAKEALEKLKTALGNKLNESKNKDECFLHLAQIADAAGKIQGISICKNRQYIIMDTQKEDELTGEPLFIAQTEEGE